ncbi:MAG TPA: helix-turn-helix domain-containing protein, partial [Balneolales bacterium]|nr:helix-turn-helix domain-containing protein [Balneolales bacterium]
MPSLGEDLSDLRKKENLTLKNIFDSTRIPIYILKAIEDSSIFKDPKRNRTYVRSFVRTYAKALKISESDILKALDQTYDQKYDGLIAQNYRLSKPDSENIDEDTSGASQEYQPKFSLETPSESSKEEENTEPPDETTDQEEKNELYKANTIKTSTGSDKEYTQPDSSKPHNQKMPDPPNVHNINWAAMNNKISDLKTRTPVTIIAAIIVIILAAAAFFIYTRYETPGGPQNGSGKLQSVLPMDTLNNVKSVTGDTAKAETGGDTTAMTLP